MSKKFDNSLLIYDTDIENIFINDFLPLLEEESIKVFLCANMLEQNSELASIQNLTKQTRLSVEDVKQAIGKLAGLGLVIKHGDEIHVVSMRERIFLADEREEEGPGEDQALLEESEKEKANLYASLERDTGMLLNNQYMDLTDDFLSIGTSPDVIAFAFNYAHERNKTSPEYIRAVLNDWHAQGFQTEEEVKEYIDRTQNWNRYYKGVFRELGFSRMWGAGEADRMRRWVEDLGFSQDEVIAICREKAGVANPNFNYIESILNNIYEERTGRKPDGPAKEKIGREIKITNQDVDAYYREIRQKEAGNLKSRLETVKESVGGLEELLDRKKALIKDKFTALKGGRSMDLLNKELEKNASEIEKLLQEYSLPSDILEHRYLCKLCKDTGKLEDGSQCECFPKRRAELYDKKAKGQ